MKYEDIEPYILDYLDGKADEATQYRIQAYLKENPDFQEELDELATTLEYSQELPKESPRPELKMNFYTMLQEAQEKEKKKQTWGSMNAWLSQIWWQRLALSGALMLIFFVGYWSSDLLNPTIQSKATSQSLETSPEESEKKQARPLESEDSQALALEKSTEETAEKQTAEKPSPILPSREDAEEEMGIEAVEEVEDEVLEDLNISPEDTPPSPVKTALSPKNKAEEKLKLKTEPYADEVVSYSRSKASNKRRSKKAERVILSPPPPSEIESDERIEEIYTQLDGAGEPNEGAITQTLLNTIQTDPNPNVRIAAIDALDRFMDQKEVQNNLAASLQYQDSPNTQLATIDLLVKYQIKAGKKALKDFLKQGNLNKTVREQAQIALKILS